MYIFIYKINDYSITKISIIDIWREKSKYTFLEIWEFIKSKIAHPIFQHKKRK